MLCGAACKHLAGKGSSRVEVTNIAGDLRALEGLFVGAEFEIGVMSVRLLIDILEPH